MSGSCSHRPKPSSSSSRRTVAELHFGAERSGRPETNRARLRVFLEELRSVPFDDRCGDRFGRLKAERLAACRQVPDFDLAIAATVIAHGHTLVSSDRHMSSLPGVAEIPSKVVDRAVLPPRGEHG